MLMAPLTMDIQQEVVSAVDLACQVAGHTGEDTIVPGCDTLDLQPVFVNFNMLVIRKHPEKIR